MSDRLSTWVSSHRPLTMDAAAASLQTDDINLDGATDFSTAVSSSTPVLRRRRNFMVSVGAVDEDDEEESTDYQVPASQNANNAVGGSVGGPGGVAFDEVEGRRDSDATILAMTLGAAQPRAAGAVCCPSRSSRGSRRFYGRQNTVSGGESHPENSRDVTADDSAASTDEFVAEAAAAAAGCGDQGLMAILPSIDCVVSEWMLPAAVSSSSTPVYGQLLVADGTSTTEDESSPEIVGNNSPALQEDTVETGACHPLTLSRQSSSASSRRTDDSKPTPDMTSSSDVSPEVASTSITGSGSGRFQKKQVPSQTKRKWFRSVGRMSHSSCFWSKTVDESGDVYGRQHGDDDVTLGSFKAITSSKSTPSIRRKATPCSDLSLDTHDVEQNSTEHQQQSIVCSTSDVRKCSANHGAVTVACTGRQATVTRPMLQRLHATDDTDTDSVFLPVVQTCIELQSQATDPAASNSREQPQHRMSGPGRLEVPLLLPKSKSFADTCTWSSLSACSQQNTLLATDSVKFAKDHVYQCVLQCVVDVFRTNNESTLTESSDIVADLFQVDRSVHKQLIDEFRLKQPASVIVRISVLQIIENNPGCNRSFDSVEISLPKSCRGSQRTIVVDVPRVNSPNLPSCSSDTSPFRSSSSSQTQKFFEFNVSADQNGDYITFGLMNFDNARHPLKKQNTEKRFASLRSLPFRSRSTNVRHNNEMPTFSVFIKELSMAETVMKKEFFIHSGRKPYSSKITCVFKALRIHEHKPEDEVDSVCTARSDWQSTVDNFHYFVRLVYSRALHSDIRTFTSCADVVDSKTRAILNHFATYCRLRKYAKSAIELAVVLRVTCDTVTSESDVGGQNISNSTTTHVAATTPTSLILERLQTVAKTLNAQQEARDINSVNATTLLVEAITVYLQSLPADITKYLASVHLFPLSAFQSTHLSTQLSLTLQLLHNVLKTLCGYYDNGAISKARNFLTEIYIKRVKSKIQDETTSWVKGQLRHIEASSQCTIETIVEDTNNFTAIVRKATEFLMPDAAVLQYFQQLDVDYYSIASRKLDTELAKPAEEFVQRMNKFQKRYHLFPTNVQASSRSSAGHCLALRDLFERICCNISASSDGNRARACMLSLSKHFTWFDDCISFMLQSFRYVINDAVKASLELDKERVVPVVEGANYSSSAIILEHILKKEMIAEWNKMYIADINYRLLGVTKLTDIVCDAVVLYTDTIIKILEGNKFFDFNDNQQFDITSPLCIFINNISRAHDILDSLPAELLWKQFGTTPLSASICHEVETEEEHDTSTGGGETPLKVLQQLVDCANEDVKERMQALMIRIVDMMATSLTAFTELITVPDLEHCGDRCRCHPLLTYLDENFTVSKSTLHGSMFSIFQNALCYRELEIFCGGLDKCQPPRYYKEMMKHLERLLSYFYGDGSTPPEEVQKLYDNIMSGLRERSTSSEELVLQYYESLSATNDVDSSSLYYGKLLVGTHISNGTGATDQQQSTLTVKVIQADHLPGMMRNNLSNPYVTATLCPSTRFPGTRHQRTSVVYKTVSPRYNQTFEFQNLSPENLQHSVLLLSVWHHDPLMSDTFLGEVIILVDKHRPYTTIQRQPMSVHWMLLKRPKEVLTGPFAMLRSRYYSDPEARQLLRQRCESVGWAVVMAADDKSMQCGQCAALESLATSAWNNAIIKLTGRRAKVPLSEPTISHLADISTPFTPFVTGLPGPLLRRRSSVLGPLY